MRRENLPRMMRVRQHFDAPHLSNVSGHVVELLTGFDLKGRIQEGAVPLCYAKVQTDEQHRSWFRCSRIWNHGGGRGRST